MMIYMSGKLLKNASTEKVAGDGMVSVASRWLRGLGANWGSSPACRVPAERRDGLRLASQEWLLGSNDIGEKSPVDILNRLCSHAISATTALLPSDAAVLRNRCRRPPSVYHCGSQLR
jgi:hypothetical protein